MNFDILKEFLEKEVEKRDKIDELSLKKPDPMLVATQYKDEFVALICALFAYGNASQIVKFLLSLDFTLLDQEEDKIKKDLKKHYYRFQNNEDVMNLFITLKRVKQDGSLEDFFYEGYKKENSVLDGLSSLIAKLTEVNPYESRGYTFLIGKMPTKKSSSTYKRWNMFLRWMVRNDNIDLGLWKRIDKKDLLIPLDTHTFEVSKQLGLLKRKSYDLKAVMMLTEKLKEFDKSDPVKYDFPLYRIGQEKILATIK